MASPSEAFSELRALLQTANPSWEDFTGTLTAILDEMSAKHTEHFQAQYQSYLESELDEKFEDWMRVMSLENYIKGRGPHPLHIALTRHLEVSYDRSIFVKRYLAKFEAMMKTRPIKHFTALSIDNLATRNAFKLIEILATHGPAQLKTFGWSLQTIHVTERSKHAELYEALLTLPTPDTLQVLTVKSNSALSLKSEPILLDALQQHLPRYPHIEHISIGEGFKDVANFNRLRDMIPSTATRVSINTSGQKEMESWLHHKAFDGLEVLRLGGMSRVQILALQKHDTLISIPHVDFDWHYYQHPWDSPRTLLAHTLERASAQMQDIDPSQLLMDTLALGDRDPITLNALRALLFDPQGRHRTFPLLTSLKLSNIDSESFALLMQRGAQCFPHITALHVRFQPDVGTSGVEWSRVLPWRTLSTLILYTSDASTSPLLEGLWDRANEVLFPKVQTLELRDFDLAAYTHMLPTVFERFPSLKTFGRLGWVFDSQSHNVFLIIDMMKRAGFLQQLPTLQFYMGRGVGHYISKEQAHDWLSLAQDDSVPLNLRRYILHQVLAQPRKTDLLDHIGPELGITLPKSGSKATLISHLLASIPEELRCEYPIKHGGSTQMIDLQNV